MTVTEKPAMLEDVAGGDKKDPTGEPTGDGVISDAELDGLMARAQADGVELLGDGGLLAGLTKRILERAMGDELTDHLGYERGDPAGRGSGNNRNGTTPKRVLTDVGAVDLDVPRDRNGSFDPKIVPKGATRLAKFNENIVAFYAQGMSTRDIKKTLKRLYDVDVSPDLISRVTDGAVEELRDWQHRPLDAVYPIMYVDALVVKVRTSGTVVNRPAYVAVGVDVEGRKHVLGVWLGDGGEGAKFSAGWPSSPELRARGVADVLIVCCDGLKGLPDAIEATWPQASVQTCVVHLIRASMRYCSWKDRKKITAALRPIYTAVNAEAAADAMDTFELEHGDRCPAIVALWRSSWERFTPFLAFPADIRRIVYTTNLVESVNYQLRKASKTRGHFPDDESALKLLRLIARDITTTRGGVAGTGTWGWKEALNSVAIQVLFARRALVHH